MSLDEAEVRAEEYLRAIVDDLLARESYTSGEYNIAYLVAEYVDYEMWDSDIEKFLEIAHSARIKVFGFSMPAETIYTLEDIQKQFIKNILMVACSRRVECLRCPT